MGLVTDRTKVRAIHTRNKPREQTSDKNFHKNNSAVIRSFSQSFNFFFLMSSHELIINMANTRSIFLIQLIKQ